MSIFSIGVSGLHSAQIALSTTSNNISNVFTPGYNRELTLLNEQSVGGGVRVTDVQRQFDYFISGQLNSAASGHAALRSYETQVSQIDNLLADLDAGLAPLLQNFFSALQDLAGAPSDPAARQGVIGAADSLSAQIRSLDGYLQDMQDGIDAEIGGEVTQVNNMVEQIARLNHEIGIARARNGQAPNALLNQRDQLVSDLGQRIDVRLHVQDGGHYNLTIGNGQPLVAGTRAYGLAVMDASSDPSRQVVGYRDSAGNLQELKESVFTGGALGGLMSFRAETLDGVQNEVGRLAVSLALAFNAQHEAGFDLNGDPGQAFFAVGAPLVYGDARNAGSAVLDARFDDAAGLTGRDYDLEVSDAAAGEFLITPRGGGAAVTAVLDGAGQLEFGGMLLTVDDPALLGDGDRFLVQPTRRAAGGLENQLRDTALVAAAEADGSGDNRNALALQDLQNERLVGGGATLNQSYAALVGEVGNRTGIVKVNLQAQESLTEQIRQVQQSESGVNLDEEAANLIRFQQYYQANARIIEVGATLFDTLLGLRT